MIAFPEVGQGGRGCSRKEGGWVRKSARYTQLFLADRVAG
jgi:hypothetical protein